MKICPYCNVKNEDINIYCSGCGTKITQGAFLYQNSLDLQPPAEAELESQKEKPKRKKSLIFGLGAVLLVGVVLLIVGLWNGNGPVRGECGVYGDHLIWEYDGDGTLIISGEGDMVDFAYSDSSLNDIPFGSNSCWGHLNSEIHTVVLEPGVTSIGNGAFSNCDLQSIEIPDTVTKIGDGAFSYSNLREIELPKGLQTIEDYTFYMCRDLRTVTIPQTVTAIDEWAFSDCVRLANITLPDSLVTIERYAFDECRIEHIKIPEGVYELKDDNFPYLKKVELPGSLRRIDCTWLSGAEEVTFTGDPPRVDGEFRMFGDENVTMYYPKNNPKWTQEAMETVQGENANVTWIGY